MEILPFFLSGLLLGSIYGLSAVGLSFIFGVLKVANVGHGSLVMLGAYVAFFAFVGAGVVPFVSVVAAALIGGVIGYLLYFLVIKPLKDVGELHILVALFAFGMLMAEGARIAWGPDFVGYSWSLGSVEIGGLVVEFTKAAGAAAAAFIAVGFDQVLRRTYYGRAVRAVVQDPVGAQVVGVDIEKIYASATAIGMAIVAASGVLITLFIPVGINPYMGGPYTLMAFVIAVMGGLGSVLGAYVAGLIFGLISSLGYYIFSLLGFAEPSQMALFLAFLILLIILLIKPTGLFRL